MANKEIEKVKKIIDIIINLKSDLKDPEHNIHLYSQESIKFMLLYPNILNYIKRIPRNIQYVWDRI